LGLVTLICAFSWLMALLKFWRGSSFFWKFKRFW